MATIQWRALTFSIKQYHLHKSIFESNEWRCTCQKVWIKINQSTLLSLKTKHIRLPLISLSITLCCSAATTLCYYASVQIIQLNDASGDCTKKNFYQEILSRFHKFNQFILTKTRKNRSIIVYVDFIFYLLTAIVKRPIVIIIFPYSKLFSNNYFCQHFVRSCVIPKIILKLDYSSL